jgi:RNA polymerase sigma factor (sigma-70 family)
MLLILALSRKKIVKFVTRNLILQGEFFTMTEYLGSKNEDYLPFLNKFEGVIWNVAKKFSTGTLELDDLYQEGLLVLDECILKYANKFGSCDHNSKEFSYCFKAHLFHKYNNLRRFYQRGTRDCRKMISENRCSELDGEVTSIFDTVEQDTYPNPDIAIELSSLKVFINDLKDKLSKESSRRVSSSADKDALIVLDILLNSEETGCSESCERPRKTYNELSELLGWSTMKVNRAFSNLRKRFKTVAVQHEISCPS